MKFVIIVIGRLKCNFEFLYGWFDLFGILFFVFLIFFGILFDLLFWEGVFFMGF